MALLLDTCAVIWLLKEEAMSAESVAAIDAETKAGRDIFLSPTSAWELGMLESLERVVFAGDVIRRIEGLAGLAFAEQTPRLLYDSNFLPGQPPNDPADRNIIATAREFGLQLVTRDAAILTYGKAGHVRCLAC
jgi:PIN domain nuclease of toxin-antitoxin system